MSRWIELIKLNEAQGFKVTGISFAPTADDVSSGRLPVNYPPIPPPPSIPSVGSYVVTCGKKYKGQRLDQMKPNEIKNYMEYIVRGAEESGKPLTNGPKGNFLEFVEMADQYLKNSRR